MFTYSTLHMNVYCGLINNAPKVEELNVHQLRADQQTMVKKKKNHGIASHTMGLLFNCKKEGSTDSCYTTRDTENIMVSEGSQTQKATDCVIMFILNF